MGPATRCGGAHPRPSVDFGTRAGDIGHTAFTVALHRRNWPVPMFTAMRERLRRLKQRETKVVFATVLAGKVLGVAGVLLAMKGFAWFFSEPVGASTTAVGRMAQATGNVVSATNTAWVLVAAFLVFFMQAGFMALEAGFARSRETVNILLECVFDTCLCGILYWAIGFAFQFGGGNSLIGHNYFFLQGIPKTYTYAGAFDTKVAFLAFFLFQFAFADTASTITSGAMVGRTGFKGDILYSLAVSGFIYPIFGHWVWGPGGWLGNTMGWFHGISGDAVFRDFAGSTVVHTVGGLCALAGAIALGPRLGRKFTPEGAAPPRPTTSRSQRSAPSSSGSVGTASTPARRCPRWTSRGSVVWPPTPRWPQQRAAWSPCCSSTRGRTSGTSACRSTGSSEAWSPSRRPATGCHRSVP